MLKAVPLFLFALTIVGVHAHNAGLHRLEGEPPTEPELPEITGPFEIIVRVRFDDWSAGSFQRVFDIAAGLSLDTITLSQADSTRTMMLGIETCADGNGNAVVLSEPDVIENGVIATWTVGLDPSGLLYMIKDGVMVGNTTTTCVPRNVPRPRKYIGFSQHNSHTPLHGAVLGIRIRNLPSLRSLSDFAFENIPGKIGRDFTATFYARFDQLGSTAAHPQGSQHIFEFAKSASEPHTNQVYFAQVGDTADVELFIEYDGDTYSLIAPDAIVVGEFAYWHVEIDDGLMSIHKNSTAGTSFMVEKNYPNLDDIRGRRKLMLIGESSDALNRPLDGVVLGLRFD